MHKILIAMGNHNTMLVQARKATTNQIIKTSWYGFTLIHSKYCKSLLIRVLLNLAILAI